AVFAVAADQCQSRARLLLESSALRACGWLRFLLAGCSRRSDARLGLEVLRDDNTRSADLTELEVRRDIRPALRARGAARFCFCSDGSRAAVRPRRFARATRTRIECDRLSATRTLRHSDWSQRATRVAHQADVHRV